MLTVVKFKRPGQQNHVYDTETRWSGNPEDVGDDNKVVLDFFFFFFFFFAQVLMTAES